MAEPWQGAYANETYLRSLAASSSDVDREVSNALTEIGRQKAVYQADAAKIAPTQGRLLDQTQGQLSGDLTSLGVPQMQSVQNYFTSGRETAGTIGDLMRQGFGEQATRRSGQVRNLQSDLVSDLRQKGLQYVSGRSQEDRQMAFQTQQAAAQRALQEELANRQISAQQQIAQMEAQFAEEQRQKEYWDAIAAAVAMGAGPEPVSDSRVQYLAMKDRQNLGLDAR